jgi:hypothetical protein
MNQSARASSFGDGFGSVPRRHLIKGQRLDWSKDMWTADGNDVGGTELLALGVTAGWRKWQDGRPIDRVPGHGEPPISREQLPDRDRRLWIYRDGKPEDPWRECCWLGLVDPKTKQHYTFVADFYWSLLSIEQFDAKISAARTRTGQPYLAVVALKSAAKKKDDPAAGLRPVLRIVRWVLKPELEGGAEDDDAPLPAGAGDEAIAEEGNAIEPASSGDYRRGLDDEIPF